MGRPRGAKTAAYVEATPAALRAEARARFLDAFGVPWSVEWKLRLGDVLQEVSGALRRGRREQRVRRALVRLRTAAKFAGRVASEERQSDRRYTTSTTDLLVEELGRLVAALPSELMAESSPWTQKRISSMRATVARNAPKHLDPSKLRPRELAAIGILVGVRPTVNEVTEKRVGKRRESVQLVLEREANAYARMKQRRKPPR